MATDYRGAPVAGDPTKGDPRSPGNYTGQPVGGPITGPGTNPPASGHPPSGNKPPTTGTPPPAYSSPTPSPNFDNNAWEMLRSVLASWGLQSLGDIARGMLVAGDSADVIPIKLRETNEYKDRFSGNEKRRRAGLAALSEAEYLSIESSYKSLIRQYVGAGTYDTKDNFDKWFESNTSPTELNARFTEYQSAYQNSPQSWKDAWSANGLTPRDAIRMVMDPKVTETDLKRDLAAYSITGEMFSAYGDFNMNRGRELADYGVTQEDARRGFQDVARRENNDQALFRMAGDSASREDLQDEVLLNDQNVGERRRKAYGQEEARFQGNYLGTGQGALSREQNGQY